MQAESKAILMIKSPQKPSIARLLLSEFLHVKNRAQDRLLSHIWATYQWICRAQDKSGDGGISGWYNLFRGWMPSYPETTGYTIPTMFLMASVFSNDEARSRAITMADFELKVQMPDGAVISGTLVKEHREPAVFNTGQVIFGWLDAYKETGNERYLEAADRAAQWLVATQDEDGAWRRCLSSRTFTDVCTYNARTAWALIRCGLMSGRDRYIEAGRANLDWCLLQQNGRGWYHNNGFHPGDNHRPLLHTIGYVVEGLLESGALLQDDKYIRAAERTASALLHAFYRDGCLLGRYDENWNSPVTWRCLTGDAQIAVTWFRLYQITGNPGYLAAARRVNGQIMGVQVMRTPNGGIQGGIKGSHPIWGGYMGYSFVNWGAKFFLDSLLLDLQCGG